MADERLRELERRFKESGLVEDEIAWLSARLRAGNLTEDNLRIAAELRHRAALRVLDISPLYNQTLRKVMKKIGRLAELEGVIRMSLAIVRQSAIEEIDSRASNLQETTLQELRPLVEMLNQGIAQVEKLLAPHSQEERGKSKALVKEMKRIRENIDDSGHLYFARYYFSHMTWLISEATYTGKTASDRADDGLRAHMNAVEGPHKDRLIKMMLRNELVPWALGYPEPRNRIELP